MASLSKEVCTGLNILKKGQDPPLRPDDQLPDWLWTLAVPEKTLNELKRMKEDELTLEQVRLCTRMCVINCGHACMQFQMHCELGVG